MDQLTLDILTVMAGRIDQQTLYLPIHRFMNEVFFIILQRGSLLRQQALLYDLSEFHQMMIDSRALLTQFLDSDIVKIVSMLNIWKG